MQGFKRYISDCLKICDVYLVFDRYHDYSIKSSTRLERLGDIRRSHTLTKLTPLPSQSSVLNCTNTKLQLIERTTDFLMDEFTKQRCQNKLIITGKDEIPYQTHLGVRLRRGDMQTSHEEADVIIPQQVLQAVNEGNQCVKVICDDTYVFILLMYFYHQQKVKSIVLLESTGSTRSVICIGSTVKKHEEMVPYLPAV